MGGAILRFKAEGLRVGVLDLTNGEPTPFGSPEIRAAETAASTRLLGIDWRENLGLPNRSLEPSLEARAKLAEIRAILERGADAQFPALPPADPHKAHTVYQPQHLYLALAVAYAQRGDFERSVAAARAVLEIAPHELNEDAPPSSPPISPPPKAGSPPGIPRELSPC